MTKTAQTRLVQIAMGENATQKLVIVYAMDFKTNSNYHQVVNMTHEEKFAMYDKLPKEDIINMLIECNNVLDSVKHITFNGNTNDVKFTFTKKE